MDQEALFLAAKAHFDALNAQDPQLVDDAGLLRPKELVQAERLEAWMLRLVPEPSLALRLAVRCQHLGRFRMPRSTYPEGRVAYLSWRKELARLHAQNAREILEQVGAGPELVDAVRAINLKQDLKGQPEVQAMEDALCLSFLEHEFVPFVARHADDKVVDIVQKTWRKMSAQGHALALELPLRGRALELVQRALS